MAEDNRYDAYFFDLAEEGAEYGLLCLMTGISEEHWAAGWMQGLEHRLWEMVEGGERGYGMGEVTERQVQLLRLLSEEGDCWWRWDDGPRQVSLDAWKTYLALLPQEPSNDG